MLLVPHYDTFWFSFFKMACYRCLIQFEISIFSCFGSVQGERGEAGPAGPNGFAGPPVSN